MKTVGLFFNRTGKVDGCQKVMLNTLAGLKELGVTVHENRLGDMNGTLHGVEAFRNKTLPSSTLIGPEIIVLPSENKSMYNRWNNFVHPGLWVKECMMKYPIAQKVNHYIWPVGIDTEEFNNEYRQSAFKQDCFIYYKNVTKQNPSEELFNIEQKLKSMNLTFKTIRYGSYKEDEMKELARTSKFCLYYAGSESQNIAIMELMACDIPIYVMDQKTFKYKGFTYKSDSVSSAPYFGDECGMKVNGIDLGRLEEFISKCETYKPRDYILNNHTLAKGAQKYLDILEEINNVEYKKI